MCGVGYVRSVCKLARCVIFPQNQTVFIWADNCCQRYVCNFIMMDLLDFEWCALRACGMFRIFCVGKQAHKWFFGELSIDDHLHGRRTHTHSTKHRSPTKLNNKWKWGIRCRGGRGKWQIEWPNDYDSIYIYFARNFSVASTQHLLVINGTNGNWSEPKNGFCVVFDVPNTSDKHFYRFRLSDFHVWGFTTEQFGSESRKKKFDANWMGDNNITTSQHHQFIRKYPHACVSELCSWRSTEFVSLPSYSHSHTLGMWFAVPSEAAEQVTRS